MGTPLSYAHFLNADGGSFYALDHDRQRFFPKNFYLRLRPEIPEVPGLYLTGSDAMTLGFVGAMAGGLICAQQVLGIHNPMTLLRKRVEYEISDDERWAPDAVYTAV
uniref:Amine oxidase domain-containing protein n=1 Tax=Ditylum brightwellii TaxID=49249 RepID=A0A6V2ACP5_9STRA